MSHSTDIRVVAVTPYFLNIETRIPYYFGNEVLTHATCLRVCVEVEDRGGKRATGWGEAPLGAGWSWPSATLGVGTRNDAMAGFCLALASAWREFGETGHALEIGLRFLEQCLPDRLSAFNEQRADPMPWLAALVCASAYDLAVHDAFGMCHGLPTYDTYTPDFLNSDLNEFLSPADDARVDFGGRHPADYLLPSRQERIAAWHAVGGGDLLDDSERTGNEPDDGYPVVLPDWIVRDGLKCLKIKLTGQQEGFDYERIVQIGEIGLAHGCEWLCTDFNCTVESVGYVNEILDRLLLDHPRIFQMILYVEQPFPYDLEANEIDVRSIAARKPIYMDESAHDWRHVRLGRSRGWTGVALKTCKTQSIALLSLCWARAHGMTLMVQDLTNPMLAQVTHALLCAHAGTVLGLETNGMQFYPEASAPEAAVHPGIYRRRNGHLDLGTLQGPGFGYRIDEIGRDLPEPAA